MGGNTVVSTTFTTTYSTPFALSNNVVTQAALTAGSAAFGALTPMHSHSPAPGSMQYPLR